MSGLVSLLPVSWQPVAPAAAVLVAGGAVALVAVALGVRRTRERREWLLVAAMAGLLSLAALGPGLGRTDVAARRPAEVQVLVVLDRTVSMSALDGRGGAPRLDVARADLAALPEALPAARYGLLTWGSTARVVLPFTSDGAAFARALDLVEREKPTEGRGSRVDRPLAAVEGVLRRTRAQHPERDTVLVLVTDGENTAPGEQASYAPLAGLVAGGAVVGYGTAAGAPMPLVEGRTDDLVPDLVRGGTATSRKDEANLRTVAGQLGVPLVDGGDAAATADALAGLTPPTRPVAATAEVAHHVGWLVGLVLAALAATALRRSSRGLLEALRLAPGRRQRA